MEKQRISWIQEMCKHLSEVEAETLKVLGDKKGHFFVDVANDWMAISSAIRTQYPDHIDLVFVTTLGLWKEVSWLNTLFLAGNYPLLLARMRYVWESVFRSYYVEDSPSNKANSLEEKLVWLECHEGQLNWSQCVEPVLRKVFPLADAKPEVRDHYKTLLNHLHKYAHPSAYLLVNLCDESALHTLDSFDHRWANETLDVAAEVFDLVWLVILAHFPKAFDQLTALHGDYPVLQLGLKNARGG